MRSFAPITSDLSEAFMRLTEPQAETEEGQDARTRRSPNLACRRRANTPILREGEVGR